MKKQPIFGGLLCLLSFQLWAQPLPLRQQIAQIVEGKKATIGVAILNLQNGDTLRINGQASLSTDPGLLQSMSVNDRVPTLAIVVQVAEVSSGRSLHLSG